MYAGNPPRGVGSLWQICSAATSVTHPWSQNISLIDRNRVCDPPVCLLGTIFSLGFLPFGQNLELKRCSKDNIWDTVVFFEDSEVFPSVFGF